MRDVWLGALLGGVLAAGVLLIGSARRPGRAVGGRSGVGAGARLRAWLLRAGLPGLSPVGLVTITVGSVALCSSLTAALFGVPALALAAGCAGGAAPWGFVGWRAGAARVTMRAAWPDVVDQLISAVRSGIALPEAVAGLATTGPEQAREPFARFGREYRATGAFGRCAELLKAELADPIGDRVLETLMMAREVGGTELVAVLQALGVSLREDAAVRRELEARQGWVVNAARLGAASPWLVLALLVTRPEGREAYGTPAGSAVILVSVVVSVVAYRVMIVIGRLPQERRWFR
ncbi:MAG TPA: type II secretion system F family protein [Gryllotalpicola sp.]